MGARCGLEEVGSISYIVPIPTPPLPHALDLGLLVASGICRSFAQI